MASTLAQNKLVARPTSADHLLWEMPIAGGVSYEEWLPSARQAVSDFALQQGLIKPHDEDLAQEQEVDRLLYQLYCQLRRARKKQSLARQVGMARAILNLL